MDELIEQMAAKSPAGPACPTCGNGTHLVVYGEQWCSRCRVLRPFADDPRVPRASREPADLRLAVGGRSTRAA